MASKKDISDIKSSINQINLAISEIRDSIIKSLINNNLQLKDPVRKLEVELTENQQYQRRSNIVISGIPSSIKDENVGSTVVDILNKIDVPVAPRDIQAAHRIGRYKERTIVRFVNRKDAEAALSNRRTLKDFDATSVGLEKGTKIYIEENFCPFISKIGFMCRKLKRGKHIFSTWMGMGRVHIKVREKDKPEIINHPDELITAYPGFEFS